VTKILSDTIKVVLASAILGSVAACGGDSTGAEPEPPKETPRVALLEISGPGEQQSWVDPTNDQHVCHYEVTLAAEGDPGSIARWDHADVTISLGQGYEPIRTAFDSTFLASAFGPSPVRFGEVRVGNIGMRLIFPAMTTLPWTDGQYWARWTIHYFSAGNSHAVPYQVRCSLPPPLRGPTGRYALQSIDDEPLPAPVLFNADVLADTLTFFADSTYDVATTWKRYNGELVRAVSSGVRYSDLTSRTFSLPNVFSGGGSVTAGYSDSTLTATLGTKVWRFRRVR
jgi:hypothetical protein